MTSKEAVELAKRDLQICYEDGEENNEWLRRVIEGLKKAEKDLDVLEIIKKNKDIIFSKNPNYDNVSADDFFTIKERLENE